MSAAEADVTVAVVSWNTRELLRRCLESLAPEVDRNRASVWVVDNGSTDGSRELVAERFPWVSLVTPDENLGFGPAVNVVAERTQGEWLVAANADVALRPGALKRLVAAGRERRAGAVAPRLVMPDGRTQHSIHPFPGLRLAVAFNLGLARIVPGLGERLCLDRHWDPDRPRDVDWALGALLLIDRRAFDEVGGFDPGQWMYAEDLDLCWRLRRAGHSIRYEPDAEVLHEVSAAARKAFAGEIDRRHLDAAYLWMARRRGILVARTYAAMNLAGAAVRGLALEPLARVRPRRFGQRRALAWRYAGLHRRALWPGPMAPSTAAPSSD